MAFTNKPPKWDAAGAEPSAELQTNGFAAGYKPPAAYFNYLFHAYTECIKELQQNAATHNVQTYKSFPEIGLYEGGETIEAIAKNLPNYSELIVITGAGSANIYPDGKYGLLRVTKIESSRVLFSWAHKETGIEYFGVYSESNANVWSGWRKDMDEKPPFIEISPSASADHGGYIDFHYAGAEDDYTSRIIESAKGVINILATLKANGKNVITAENLTVDDFKNIKFQHHNAENDHRLIIYFYVTDTTFWRVDLRARDKVIQYRYFIDGVEQINFETKPSDDYLPLAGGTLTGGGLGFNNGYAQIANNGSLTYIDSYNVANDRNNYRRIFVSNSNDKTLPNCAAVVDVASGAYKEYPLYGAHNKPASSYVGNGSTAERRITIGGTGTSLLITNSTYGMLLVSGYGAIYKKPAETTVQGLSWGDVMFSDGVLIIKTSDSMLNKSGMVYNYQVL